jgi:ribonuclease HI
MYRQPSNTYGAQKAWTLIGTANCQEDICALNRAKSQDLSVESYRIPAYQEIEGNELADKLAKRSYKLEANSRQEVKTNGSRL